MSQVSLRSINHKLAKSSSQIDVLERDKINGFPSFREKIRSLGYYLLKPAQIEILQVNIGKMCNQTCKHCHVDAGPDRKEIMTKATMEMVLEAAADDSIHTVDITGGAPEMNPDFR